MTSATRAVTSQTLGAWLFKTDPASTPVAELAADGFRDVTTRCVRRSYRTDLMAPGQLVLLWVSGRDPRTPAGIYAQGRLVGLPHGTPDDGWEVPVDLRPLGSAVPRTELLADPILSQIEVLRMPAGSNPSYLTVEELTRLRDAWPHLHG